jgi:iron complex transport system ATP-binding protein
VPFVELKSVVKRYGNNTVLQNVDLSIEKGEIIAVIGRSGSGKSTMLRTLTGLLPLREGRVMLAGRDQAGLRPRERAQVCAVQPQVEAPLFDYLVRDFVLLGRHPRRALIGPASAEDHRAANEAMKQTDLTALGARSILSLSSGEWQRALLARALAQDTPVLLLDEPAAHLDPGHRHAVHVLLGNLARQRDRAVLCVSHDLNLAAEFCDRLMLIAGGIIRALGTPADVLREDLLQEVFRCPALRVINNPFSGKPGTVFAS